MAAQRTRYLKRHSDSPKSGAWPATAWWWKRGRQVLGSSAAVSAGRNRGARTVLEVGRATLDGWVMRVDELAVSVVTVMRQDLLRESYLQADETIVPVQMHDKRGADHRDHPAYSLVRQERSASCRGSTTGEQHFPIFDLINHRTESQTRPDNAYVAASSEVLCAPKAPLFK